MSSLAKLGKGTLLKRGQGTSPETYTTIPEILEISGSPGGTPDIIDVTNHDTSGLYRESITGLITMPEMTCRANYIHHAQQDGLRSDMEAGSLVNFQLVIPAVGGNYTATFAARVRGWQVKTPLNEQQTVEFTLQPTGAPVWA